MKSLFRSRLFLIGLALKILSLPFFGSSFSRDFFIPFLDTAVQNPLSNPWSLSPAHFFPYGSALYFLLALPRLLAAWMFGIGALGSSALGLSLLKLPLLAMDLLLLGALLRFSKTTSRKILLYYWLSPIAFYISYVHVQLDIVAMALALMSLVLLSRHHIRSSALFMALATLSKFHVIIFVPLMLVYLWNRHFAKEALTRISLWCAVFAVPTFLGFLPVFLAQRLAYVSTTSPEALRLFGAQLKLGENQVLYVGLLGVLLVLGRLCLSTRMTPRGLIIGAGLLMGSLLLATSAMPGWYFWFLPFSALFFAQNANAPKSLHWAFSLLYGLYFVLVPWLGLDTQPLIAGACFTLLQCALLSQLIAMGVLVLRYEAPLEGRASPMKIGLAGDSGAGKNFMSLVFTDLFHEGSAVVIEGDDYHKWERGNEKWAEYTHLNPRANHLLEMAAHATSLSQGMPIAKAHYDHGTGLFTNPRELSPTKTLIFQGLHTLYLRGLREDLDLKIFLAPHELIRLAWKLKRDVGERGGTPEKVLASLASRAEDARVHIDPQRVYADWIVEYVPAEPTTREQVLAGLQPVLALRHIVWNDAPVAELLSALAASSQCRVHTEVVENDINRISIRIEGEPSQATIASIAERALPNIRHITRARRMPKWHSGYEGINQLFALALLGTRRHPQGESRAIYSA